MTKRRPSNKKPTGMNKSLGNSLCNERQRNRKKYKIASTEDDLDNPAFIEETIERVLESKTFESNMEELFAKAELAGSTFNAERGAVQIVDKDSTVVVRTNADITNFNALKTSKEHLLKIPRRPAKHTYQTAEELHALENEMFLSWRLGLSHLEDMDGVALTPFERNLDIWRELWRVVERSDIIVQIVDARNPLLFRNADLEDYVRTVDPAKKNVLLINKSDLLLPEQQRHWSDYFSNTGIDVIFWSALEPTATEEDDELFNREKCQFASSRDELIALFKTKGGYAIQGRPLVVGFVGYPNVGKSSTINKLLAAKKVTVSATPGKTRRLQTHALDDGITLCDCPGLVMPSFAFDRSEMFLNGIMPIEQMRDHFGPISLLISRVPADWICDRYSLTLAAEDIDAVKLLTAIAFVRGMMSSSGVPDCSRAARLLAKDVVVGKILWVAAPPSHDQKEFDDLFFLKKGVKIRGQAQLRQMEKKGLIESSKVANERFDQCFFDGPGSQAHVMTRKPGVTPLDDASKKHFKKKDKARRMFVQTYS
ncbi:hypothetical protein PMAYCL1PPCAC_23802 [Pristionchus mayeri]|uniref:Large subunit GTPase 1 homolog n=1 Tax=Pristionchus mayeri TaxID=1317129 RepID=A0AAN5I5Z2_9BILA|nr:hypothetical protein PMAYCL1PPCAC_23802 [Pristionchus mayeri]